MSSDADLTNSSPDFEALEVKLVQAVREAQADGNRTLPLAILLNNLAVVHHAQRRFPVADAAHKQCASILESLDNAPQSLAQSLSNRAALYRTFEEYHEAERVFQLATALWDSYGWPTLDAMRWRIENAHEVLTAEMLWADVIEANGLLRAYSREVQQLRQSPKALQRTLAKLGPWYHDVQLTPEVSTYPANREYVSHRWKLLCESLPADLSGKAVLDIGCNGGYFSLQMKQRNASRVLGIDIMPHFLAQTRFVAHWFAQPVELRELSAYDVASLGEFEIVIFIGVLYHLRHPLYAIDKVASICRDTMYLQSLIRGDTRDFEPAPNYAQGEQDIFKRPEFPRMYFIEKSFNSDVSNWWVPNTSCLMAMARSAGFRHVQQSSHPELIVCRK